MSGTRGCVLVCGAALILAGLGEMTLGSVEASGFPSIPALLLGCVIVITAIAEPVYGRLTGHDMSAVRLADCTATDSRTPSPSRGSRFFSVTR